jgi:hypothetical protein
MPIKRFIVRAEVLEKIEHIPAVNNGNIGLFILTDDTKSIPFEVSRSSHYWRW